jgi:hypothetical protein
MLVGLVLGTFGVGVAAADPASPTGQARACQALTQHQVEPKGLTCASLVVTVAPSGISPSLCTVTISGSGLAPGTDVAVGGLVIGQVDPSGTFTFQGFFGNNTTLIVTATTAGGETLTQTVPSSC